jgi:hypothetical protein
VFHLVFAHALHGVAAVFLRRQFFQIQLESRLPCAAPSDTKRPRPLRFWGEAPQSV